MKGQEIGDLSVLGDLQDVAQHRSSAGLVCAGVGDPVLKRRFAERTEGAGFTIADPLVHPSIRLAPTVTVGRGTVICEGVVLTIDIRLGRHVVLNQRVPLGTTVSSTTSSQ